MHEAGRKLPQKHQKISALCLLIAGVQFLPQLHGAGADGFQLQPELCGVALRLLHAILQTVLLPMQAKESWKRRQEDENRHASHARPCGSREVPDKMAKRAEPKFRLPQHRRASLGGKGAIHHTLSFCMRKSCRNAATQDHTGL